MHEIVVNVGGMTCAGCEASVAKAIARIGGVEVVRADHRTGEVTLCSGAPVDAALVREAVEDAGYVFVPPGSSSLPLA